MQCQLFPATRIFYDKGDPNPNILVMQEYKYFIFKIYVHYIEWNQARIVWIGFYKNENNPKCLIAKLPKDIVKQLFEYLPIVNKVSLGQSNNNTFCII